MTSPNLNAVLSIKCAPGYQCQTGTGHFNNIITMEPLECGVNTFSDMEGTEVCSVCPDGFECLLNINIKPKICDIGYYKSRQDIG